MSAQYTVASLEELAAAFEQFARDDDGFARSARSQTLKMTCGNRGDIWRQAATILRNTTIQGAPHDAG